MTNVKEKMDTRPVEVRIWNADCSKYTDKVLDHDEFNRFQQSAKLWQKQPLDQVVDNGYGSQICMLGMAME